MHIISERDQFLVAQLASEADDFGLLLLLQKNGLIGSYIEKGNGARSGGKVCAVRNQIGHARGGGRGARWVFPRCSSQARREKVATHVSRKSRPRTEIGIYKRTLILPERIRLGPTAGDR